MIRANIVRAVAAAAGVAVAAGLAGCSTTPKHDALESARANCLKMAQEAIPNGMADPDDSTQVLDTHDFCQRLESGMKPEAFQKSYNDDAFLKQEVKIWSKYNLQH